MFQQTVYNQPPLAIEGDFASANPRSSSLSSAGGLVAGPLGVTAGRFAWADNEGVVRNIGGGGNGRLGFVHRDNLALITTWLGKSSMVCLPGYEITMFSAGDFWARFALGALVGQKVYANFADGSAYAAATASPPAAGAATGTIATGAASFTASIAPANVVDTDEQGGIMTVTVLASGTIQPGGTVSGTSVLAGQTVLSQVSGTAGGVGVYEVAYAQTVASEAMTEAYGTMTAVSALTGAFSIGDVISGGTTSAGTAITALGTGTGGLGTYIVNNSQTVTSSSLTSVGAVETSWYAESFAAPGELAKITMRL